MVNDYNNKNNGHPMFCPECKTMLTFDKDTGLRICKRCALQNNPNTTKKAKKTKKNLESLVLKFEDVHETSGSVYELILTDTISDLRRLNKNQNNYVLCRCNPCDGGSVEKAYISLRYFIRQGKIPKNKPVYVSDVPCGRNCADICTFTLAEKNDLVIKKIKRYKEYFKNHFPGAKK